MYTDETLSFNWIVMQLLLYVQPHYLGLNVDLFSIVLITNQEVIEQYYARTRTINVRRKII